MKFILLVFSVLCISCHDNNNVKKEDGTQSFSAIQINYTGDTVGIKDEIKSLIGIIDHFKDSNSARKISTSVKDSLYSINIYPELDPAKTGSLKTILDSVLRFKSQVKTPPLLKLVITEDDPEVLDLLHLQTRQEFPIRINYNKLRVLKEEYELNAAFTGKELWIASVLRIPTINPLTNIAYAYDTEGSESELAEASKALFKVTGGFKAAYKIVADNLFVQRWVDSVTSKSNFRLDSSGLYIYLTYFTFNAYRRYIPMFHDDSLFNETIKRMPALGSFYYQLFLAPNLCIKMKNYLIKQSSSSPAQGLAER